MKKFAIPSNQRAIEILFIIIGLNIVRGTWQLLGFWNADEYFRFEMLRILFSAIIIIKVLGFIRKKVKVHPKVQGALMSIRIIEGIQAAALILAVGTAGYFDYSVRLMVIALIRLAIYIYSLIVIASGKYKNDKSVKRLIFFVLSIICVDSLLISIGFIVAFTQWKELVTFQYFLHCIPVLFLVGYLKKMEKLEQEEQQPAETTDWKPE